MAKIQVIGIDPGLRTTGWGVILQDGPTIRYVAHGTIQTHESDALPLRLLDLQQGLGHVLQTYSPDSAAIEKTFVNSNAQSSLKLSHARGVLMATMAGQDLIAQEYDPTKVKKTIVGQGRADKQQIIAMLKILLGGVEVSSTDAADALAIAICHAQHMPQLRIQQEMV